MSSINHFTLVSITPFTQLAPRHIQNSRGKWENREEDLLTQILRTLTNLRERSARDLPPIVAGSLFFDGVFRDSPIPRAGSLPIEQQRKRKASGRPPAEDSEAESIND